MDQHSVTGDDVELFISAMNTAKNELRRTAGFSPSRAVFGRDPLLPGELLGEGDQTQYEHILTAGWQPARPISGAKVTPNFDVLYYNDRGLRAPSWRSGTWCISSGSPGIARNGGGMDLPASLGKKTRTFGCPSEGDAFSRPAPEHIRNCTGEELGDTFTLRATKENLQRLVAYDPNDPNDPDSLDLEVGEAEDDPELEHAEVPDQNELDEDAEMAEPSGPRRPPPEGRPEGVTKRMRSKGPRKD